MAEIFRSNFETGTGLPTGLDNDQFLGAATPSFAISATTPLNGSKSLRCASPANGDCVRVTVAGSSVTDFGMLFLSQVGSSGSNSFAVGALWHWPGGSGASYILLVDAVGGSGTVYKTSTWDSLHTFTVSDFTSRALVDGDIIWVRLEQAGTTIRMRVWLKGQTEPTTWSSFTDSTYASGYLGLATSFANGTKPGEFDDVLVYSSALTSGWIQAGSPTDTTIPVTFNAGITLGTAPYSTQLQYSLDGSTGWTNTGSAAAGASPSLTATSLSAGTPYYLRALTTDNASATAYSNIVQASTTGSSGLSAGTLSSGTVASNSVSLSLATNSGGTAPYSNQLQRSARGANSWSNIGSPISGTTADFTDSTVVANTSYDYRVHVTDGATGDAYSNTVQVDVPDGVTTISATNAVFVYSGYWGTNGTTKITVSNGSDCRFAFSGTSCTLLFNVTGITNYPLVSYQVDDGSWTRALLDSSGSIEITAEAGTHTVRWMANVESGYPEAVDNWNNLECALKFTGVSIPSSQTVSVGSLPSRYIEFIGDSITAGLRLLYTGTTDGPTVASPETNFPELVCQELNYGAIVAGHGGQAVSAEPATDGTPKFSGSIGYAYNGVAWRPPVDPEIVWLYCGTNDNPIVQSDYDALLTVVRAHYATAFIFAVCPQSKSSFVSTIQASVTAANDERIMFLDYSAKSFVGGDFCDGLHFNQTGANKMKGYVVADINANYVPYVPPSSFTSSTSSIPSNQSQGILITLNGVDTVWNRNTPFTVSGVTGASILSQTVSSKTRAYLLIKTGSGNGTLEVSDGNTSINITVTSAETITPSPFWKWNRYRRDDYL